MKTIKIKLKNYKNFPSMEWGEDGGTDCDVYVDKELIGHYYNDGNGGEGNFSPAKGHTYEELDKLVEKFKEANKEILNPKYIEYYNIDSIIEDLYNRDARIKEIKKKKLRLPLVIYIKENERSVTHYRSVSTIDDIPNLKSLCEKHFGPLDFFDYVENEDDLKNIVSKKRNN